MHGILQSRILEWVAVPFSRRSSQPRDQTQVSCIVGRFALQAVSLLSELPGKLSASTDVGKPGVLASPTS